MVDFIAVMMNDLEQADPQDPAAGEAEGELPVELAEDQRQLQHPGGPRAGEVLRLEIGGLMLRVG